MQTAFFGLGKRRSFNSGMSVDAIGAGFAVNHAGAVAALSDDHMSDVDDADNELFPYAPLSNVGAALRG
jgi:hypothetical protein